jgi:hypothetical protein
MHGMIFRLLDQQITNDAGQAPAPTSATDTNEIGRHDPLPDTCELFRFNGALRGAPRGTVSGKSPG